ncbi:hypothetical protein JB92DRAFT_2837353 [Gautieria morchelliformis]|nr:hypothetical protein JB92DRAFT_2837353 [Gautieria morchelliformis]
MHPQETIPLPAPVPPLELMWESNPFPPDPYGKLPPTLKSAALRRNWCRLTADVREAFWKEHLAGEESETEPESDSSLTSPSKLFQTKIARAAPVEEDTIRLKPVPSKHTSVSDLQKMGWRLAAVPQFVANYGFNPTAVLHVDWMSDEDSEPEGINKHETAHERQEAMTAWRTSCLHRLGITGDIKLHDDLALLEVVRPEWHNDYVSAHRD